MEEKNKTQINFNLNFTKALQLVFIVLKLINKINWSWWWVLAPTWIGVALAILLGIIILIMR